MEANTLLKINSWLNGNYDQSVKDEITHLQKNNPAELKMHFTEVWNLVQAALGELWALAPTV